MYRKYKFLLAFLSLSTLAYAQTDNLETANDLFNSFQYGNALPYYLKVNGSKEKTVIDERIADCYRYIGDTKNAELYYDKAIKLKGYSSETVFNYADILRNNGKYNEAKIFFLAYYKLNPAKKDQITMLIKACDLAINWKSHPSPVKIVNESALNTVFSDFSPIRFGNGLVFASDRKNGIFSKHTNRTNSLMYGWTGNSYLKLFSVQRDSGKWSKVKLLDGTVNADYHNAAASYDATESKLYFTRTNIEKNPLKLLKDKHEVAGFVNRKEIYVSLFKDGHFGDVIALPYNNRASYSVQHPFVSPNGEYLYFSSDMPGGFGGFDLYYCKKIDGNWVKPVNLGSSINTIGDEGFPYVTSNGRLYFSSNGLLGMGGLDIFTAVGKDEEWTNVTNLRYPFNSPKDDFGIMFLTDDQGFLSSNREGGIGSDDIYSFKIKVNPKATPIIVNGVAFTDDNDDNSSPNNKVGAPKIKTAKRGDATYEIIAVNNIYYGLDKWDINKSAAKELDKIVGYMKQYPALKIEIGSHTDSRSSEKYNLILSQKRASSAFNYITDKGITKTRLFATGYGEKYLVNNCTNSIVCDEADHQENRRTEFKILTSDEADKLLKGRK